MTKRANITAPVLETAGNNADEQTKSLTLEKIKSYITSLTKIESPLSKKLKEIGVPPFFNNNNSINSDWIFIDWVNRLVTPLFRLANFINTNQASLNQADITELKKLERQLAPFYTSVTLVKSYVENYYDKSFEEHIPRIIIPLNMRNEFDLLAPTIKRIFPNIKEEITELQKGPLHPGDTAVQNARDFIQESQYRQEEKEAREVKQALDTLITTVKCSAVVGLMLGAGVGAILGNVMGALVGTFIGLVAGAAVGYIAYKCGFFQPQKEVSRDEGSKNFRPAPR